MHLIIIEAKTTGSELPYFDPSIFGLSCYLSVHAKQKVTADKKCREIECLGIR